MFEVEIKQCFIQRFLKNTKFIPRLQNGAKRDRYEQLNQEEVKTPSFRGGCKMIRLCQGTKNYVKKQN